jgi:hypothetical protein
MKKALLFISFLLIAGISFGQSDRSSNAQTGKETQEQRLTRAQDKKSKGGKKNLTMQQKVKVAKKQDKKASKTKGPKQQRRPKPKN